MTARVDPLEPTLSYMSPSPSLLQDRYLQSAISQFELRAEWQQDYSHLRDTFVDPGIVVQLQNDNSQILYGRRGTGKTHLLKVIKENLEQSDRAHRLAIYIDMRQLGSSEIFEDTGRPFSVRVGGLLRDVLEVVHGDLLGYATDPRREVAAGALESLDHLGEAIIRTVLKDGVTKLQESFDRASVDDIGISVDISPKPRLSLSVADRESSGHHRAAEVTGQEVPKMFFHEVSRALNDVLRLCGISHLTLLLDEWNHIPLELQPVFAEFLRKALMVMPEVAVKIATLEYRSNFRQLRDARHNVMGFELGADISTALELDEYYVYYGAKSTVPQHFAELLYRHICRESDRQASTAGYLAEHYEIRSSDQLIDVLFAGQKAFRELVRAGEGVARDFINIFGKAFFGAYRAGSEVIDARAIRAAGAGWYELDKALNIEEREEDALRLICEQVIARNGTVNFFLSRQQERSGLIRALVDLRLLHLMQRGYRPNRNDPGARYNIYALDYGTYAHLMGTTGAPQLVTIEQMRAANRQLILLDELVKRLEIALHPRGGASVGATG